MEITFFSKEKVLWGLCLALGVFFLLGIRCYEVGFHADDYEFINQGMGGAKHVFKNADINHAGLRRVDHERAERGTFLGAVYRPLTLLMMSTGYKFFEGNARATHLIHASLHALVVFLLFLILAALTPLGIAFLGAFFFAFHASLRECFFWQCYVQNTLEAVLFLGIIFLWYWFYRTQKKYLLGLSSLFLLTSLFVRETLLFLPVFLVVGYVVFRDLSKEHQSIPWFAYFTSTVPAIGIYCLAKLWAYPLSFQSKRLGVVAAGQWGKGFVGLKNKIFDLLTYVFDLLGLGWIPEGSLFIKIGILSVTILGVFCALRMMWYECRKFALFMLTGVIIFSWPSFICFHRSRYLYLPTMFLAVFIGLILAEIWLKYDGKKILGVAIFGSFTLFCCFQIILTSQTTKLHCAYYLHEQRLHEMRAFLMRENKKTLVLGFPTKLAMTGPSGATQELLGMNGPGSIEFVAGCRTCVCGNLPVLDVLRSAWDVSVLTLSAVSYKLIGDVLTVTTSNPDKTWFLEDAINASALGELVDMQRDKEKTTGFSIRLDTQKMRDTVLMGWDYGKTKCHKI